MTDNVTLEQSCQTEWVVDKLVGIHSFESGVLKQENIQNVMDSGPRGLEFDTPALEHLIYLNPLRWLFCIQKHVCSRKIIYSTHSALQTEHKSLIYTDQA